MHIINDFFIGFAYLLVFTLVYFAVEKVLSWKKVISLNIPTEATNFIFGISMGVVGVLGKFAFVETFDPNYIAISIISVSILIYFKNWQIALYFLIPIISYKLIATDTTKQLYFEIISIFIIILVVEIARYFVDSKKLWIVLITILLVLSFVSLPLSYLYFDHYELIRRIESTTLTYNWTIIYFGLFLYFIKFSISSNLLFESSNFAFLNYYRSGLANVAVNDYITKEKIEHGILTLFRINYLAPNLTENQKTEIKETILEKLANNISVPTVMFAAPENMYGFFIEINSIKGGSKKVINNIFAAIPLSYQTSWEEVVEVEIKSGISIYGLHNSSVTPLIEYSTFALNTIGNNETIKLFSPIEYRKSSSDQKEISLMDKNIALDDYANEYFEVWDTNNAVAPFGVRAKVQNISEFSWVESVDERIYYKNWNKIFTRYFANDALQHINKVNVFIDYDLSVLDKSFSAKDFAYQLSKLKFKPNKLFLVIKDIAWSKINNYSEVKNNVQELEHLGINFVIDNKTSGALTKRIFNKTKYAFVNENKVDNLRYKKAEYICFDISSPANLKNVRKAGVKIISGSLLKSEFTFKNFDKQSKIYLEEILERGGNNDK